MEDSQQIDDGVAWSNESSHEWWNNCSGKQVDPL